MRKTLSDIGYQRGDVECCGSCGDVVVIHSPAQFDGSEAFCSGCRRERTAYRRGVRREAIAAAEAAPKVRIADRCSHTWKLAPSGALVCFGCLSYPSEVDVDEATARAAAAAG